MVRDQAALKRVDELRNKELIPDKRFYYENREVWLFITQGIGIEFMRDRAVTGFLYMP
ncbi:MAG: hypothetical protein ACE5IH_06690 [Thermodesulfobacteriota bacterium]